MHFRFHPEGLEFLKQFFLTFVWVMVTTFCVSSYGRLGLFGRARRHSALPPIKSRSDAENTAPKTE